MEISFFENKRILITGGHGYIASNLISLLQNIKCDIIRFDRPGLKIRSLNGNANIMNIEGDIRKKDDLETAMEGIDIVFYLVAQTSMRIANENPVQDSEINVLPILNLR